MLASPFYQAALICAVLLAIALLCRFRAMGIIQYGMYAAITWMVPCLFYALFVDHFWYYLVYAVFACVVFYMFWLTLVFIAGKFGQPYHGDGWWGVLVPAFMFLVLSVVVLMLRALLYLVRWAGIV